MSIEHTLHHGTGRGSVMLKYSKADGRVRVDARGTNLWLNIADLVWFMRDSGLLAEVERAAAEKAWDEAYWQGVDDAREADALQIGIGLGPGVYAQPARQNPYRKEQLDAG